jgi:exportin-1
MPEQVAAGDTMTVIGAGGNNHMDNSGRKLLDFDQKLDINLLDNVINCMYQGEAQQQKAAQEILTTLKEHPDAWTRVDTILEFSHNIQTKYYALQILENVIKSRWKALPRQQCEGIQKYIVALIIKHSSTPENLERERVYIGKLNMILVQILKYEWPKNWPSFINDIVLSSRTNEYLCQNNMVILKLLSEEVFDFSLGSMTQIKAKHLKDSMCSEFSQIFQLCQFVLENSSTATLIDATLNTLLKFLNWIPLGYIFETNLISTLVYKYFLVPEFRNITMKCLTEIAGINVKNQYDQQFVLLFTYTVTQLKEILPPEINLKDCYAKGKNEEQQFIQNLSLFLSTFLKEHGSLIEKKEKPQEMLVISLRYLVACSEVDETEIFKICLEYWNFLAAELYRENPFPAGAGPIFPTGGTGGTVDVPSRRALYSSVLSQVRYIMVSRMAKPEEVLIVETDQGELVREFMKDTDSINLYKSMRETLVYLTHLDVMDTEQILTQKLQKQVDGSEWSWKNLNTLCWAIGSISGAMHEEDEKRFLVIVIKDLLGLCEQKRGKDNKAVVASNIMYIVGQYPRFLRAHWKFLRTVVNKLFEFMHETHEGVQDMACDTLIKIAHKCRRHFVQIQVGETQPLIDEILNNINTIICDLTPQQVQTFYEAIGYMISAQNDQVLQEHLIERFMLLPNSTWDAIISEATTSLDVLHDANRIRQLGGILKTNIRACKAIGNPFVVQIGRIYLDMINVYKCLSAFITHALNDKNENVVRDPLIRGMLTCKKETLRLISEFVQRCNDPEIIKNTFLGPLLEAVLVDYRAGIAASREPEVLSTMGVIITKLESFIEGDVGTIFLQVFECTLEMINKNFEDWPEHRVNFYAMIQAVVNHCFRALLKLTPEQFKLVLDAIIWAFKHTMRNVADIGLDILYHLLTNMSSEPTAAGLFFKQYYTSILEHVFSVVTDSSHTGALSMQSNILAFMYSYVEKGQLTVLLDDSVPDNVTFVKQFTASLLKSAFPHLTVSQVQLFVTGLFSLNEDAPQFREHLRDFLVQIREYTGEDESDLYLEERQQALSVAEIEKAALRKAVPGIVNPHADITTVERFGANNEEEMA